MKLNLTCNIVQDLLPNYIEKLTSEDTNQAIEEHLDTCESCKNEYEKMAMDIVTPAKVPAIELRFFKKVKRIKILAALLCVILTLVLSYLIYSSEYHYTLDKGDLSAAVTEFTTPFEPSFNAYVLEAKAVGNTLIASFKDEANANNYGIAVFVKGLNQRYRIIKTQMRPSEYSSVIQFFQIELENTRYYIVNGYNLTSDIQSYGLDYIAYKNPGSLSKDRVTRIVRFDVENPQFMEVYPADEIDERVVSESAQTLYEYRLFETSLYDANDNEITENFRNDSESNSDGSGAGKAELFLIYVYIAIVVVFGTVMTRYFLSE